MVSSDFMSCFDQYGQIKAQREKKILFDIYPTKNAFS